MRHNIGIHKFLFSSIDLDKPAYYYYFYACNDFMGHLSFLLCADLEETMENLVMDGLDVSQYGPALLDPDVELDHVFD